MKERKTLSQRINEHKKELIAFAIGFFGGGIAAGTGINYLNERHGSPQNMPVAQPPFQIPGQFVTDAAIPVISLADPPRMRHYALPHGVGKHPRNLPDGQQASAEKIATALENGITLREGQTWVRDYMTKGETSR